jgi:ornithine carbamoyltransferase
MKTTLLGKSFITTEDWSVEELTSMLDMADDLKRRFACGEVHDQILRSKTLFMLFFEESTRTRTSFESGITQLGGHAIYLTPSATQVGHGENAKDTGTVLGRYGHGIAVRDCRTDIGQAYQYDLAKHMWIYR